MWLPTLTRGVTVSKTPKISVLVPIYNVENYLNQCLESLVNQTLADIEIICINDGSTDSSAAIIQEFQKSDSRIKVIEKPNTGYGDSMNRGLKKAAGKYIAIVEPDDYINLNAFEKLYDYASTYDAEVVRANYYINKGNKDTKLAYVDLLDAGRIINPRRHSWIFFQAPAVWSAIYKREFLSKHDIKFLTTPGASYQDTGFNFKVWANATRAYFTTEAFLHYRTDNESSSVNNPGKVMNVCYEYEEIEKYLKKHHLFEEIGPLVEAAKFGAYYWNICRLSRKLLPEFIAKVKEEYQRVNQDGLLIRSYFPIATQWNLLQFMLKHSVRRTIHKVQRQRFMAKSREVIKGIWIKTHPNYRKQRLISELISEIYAETDLIETKLNQLQAQEVSYE